MFISGGGSTPHYKRLMAFVDGTNFLIELSKEIKIDFRAEKPPLPSLAISHHLLNSLWSPHEYIKIRKYWFASYQGNDEDYYRIAKELRRLTYEPMLFKKQAGKEKGVDIGLATEMLTNAFNRNYDIGVLIAGDKDYIGLVKEVKRYGPIIWGSFFSHGLSDDLPIAVDVYFDLIKKVDANFEKEPLKSLIDTLRKEGSP
jgi:uncharacterized LabA/DUF88 family protein